MAYRPGGLVPAEVDLASSTFVAVDFETANRMGGVSACAVALVKVREGEVVERLSTYLKPPEGYDRYEFTWLHGISRNHTRNAPSWFDMEESVADFILDSPVYAHNASFDARVWKDLDGYFGLRTLPPRFYCSYRLAKQVAPGLDNYKLPTVTNAFVPGYQLDHHQADSDAEACALIVAAIQRQVLGDRHAVGEQQALGHQQTLGEGFA